MSDTITALLPCPFCGDPMVLWDFNTHARHSNHDAKCPLSHHAIRLDQWNRRALVPALSAERDDMRAKVAALLEASATFAKDVRDLIANSEGVSGLHMNGDVADWDSLLPGGAFEPWLKSIAELEATLAKIKGDDHE